MFTTCYIYTVQLKKNQKKQTHIINLNLRTELRSVGDSTFIKFDAGIFGVSWTRNKNNLDERMLFEQTLTVCSLLMQDVFCS